jgi:hypothetical protein
LASRQQKIRLQKIRLLGLLSTQKEFLSAAASARFEECANNVALARSRPADGIPDNAVEESEERLY